jgi:hypothetical protein
MRKLPLLLVLLLLSVLLAAASVQASPLPVPVQPAEVLLDEEEEGEAEESGAEEEVVEAEEEECTPEYKELELCEEEPSGQAKKDDECLLEKASATVTANPGKRRLRLTVHYKTLKPATVNVEASLRGSKGGAFLGNDHARFRRSGVYRDTFALPEKKMNKALAARDFKVELQVVNTPPSCRVELTAHRDGAKKLRWS